MSDPAFLTYEFSKSLPRPQLLTELGHGLRGLQNQYQTQQLEGQYDQALSTVHQNPTNENIARLYQVAEPLGRFQNARAAVNDLFGRMPEPVLGAPGQAVDPNQVAWEQALEAWRAQPLNEELQVNFRRAGINAGRSSETESLISDVVGNREDKAAWDAYNAAIAEYQANPTNQNFQNAVNAGGPIGMADTARQTMMDYFERLDRAEQIRIEQEWEQTFKRAQREFFNDPSSENRDAMFMAALPLGYFNNMMEYAASLSAEEREADVAAMNSILTPLSISDRSGALEAIDQYIAAATADGDETRAEQLQEIRDDITSGSIEEARNMLYMIAGTTAEGRDYLDQLYDLNKDRRAEASTAAQLIQAGYRAFENDEQRAGFIEAAEGLNNPIVNALAEMAHVMEQDGVAGGQTTEDLLDREENLRKEYDSSTEAFTTMGRAAEQIRRLIETGNASGFTDNAITTIFNKVTDPSSVVRESEAARTERAQAAFDQLRMALPRVLSGEAYSPAAKADILSAVDQLVQVADEGESMIRDRLMNTVDFMWGDDVEGRSGSVSRIFPPVDRVPIGTQTEPTLDLARDLISDRLPNVGPQVVPDGGTKTIDEMSIEELRATFPVEWERFFGDPDVIPTGPTPAPAPRPSGPDDGREEI